MRNVLNDFMDLTKVHYLSLVVNDLDVYLVNHARTKIPAKVVFPYEIEVIKPIRREFQPSMIFGKGSSKISVKNDKNFEYYNRESLMRKYDEYIKVKE